VSIEAVAIVFGGLLVIGAAMRAASWWQRARVLRSIPADQVVRQARGQSLRVLVHGPTALPGMNPRRANRTTGDLVLTHDRLVITSGRGTLVDLRADRGRRLTSVRCPGPGKLVVEGDSPGPRQTTGLFRIETMIDDAPAWAEALQPYVRQGEGRFAVQSPWSEGRIS
jgi:hypothetical protein